MERTEFEAKLKEKLLEIDQMVKEYSPATTYWYAVKNDSGTINTYNDASFKDAEKQGCYNEFDFAIDSKESEN